MATTGATTKAAKMATALAKWETSSGSYGLRQGLAGLSREDQHAEENTLAAAEYREGYGIGFGLWHSEEVDRRNEERAESLREVGRAAMDSIRELVAGLSKEHAAKEWASGLDREACLKALGIDEADQPHYVRDAGGEYLAEDGGRTPASDEAKEFDDREDAEDACERETDEAVIVDRDERSIEELREAVVEAIVEDDEEPDGFEWDEDEARERVLEDALEVQVRGGWRSVGEKEDDEAEEFLILLTTGGPCGADHGRTERRPADKSLA